MTTERRRCPSCQGFLAMDNPGPLCSPCWRSQLLKMASRTLVHNGNHAEAQQAFRQGGLPALAQLLGCSQGDALEAALGRGMLPVVYKRKAAVLHRLLELHRLSHIAAAEALGLSRWTVATYRKDLGIDPHKRAVAA